MRVSFRSSGRHERASPSTFSCKSLGRVSKRKAAVVISVCMPCAPLLKIIALLPATRFQCINPGCKSIRFALIIIRQTLPVINRTAYLIVCDPAGFPVCIRIRISRSAFVELTGASATFARRNETIAKVSGRKSEKSEIRLKIVRADNSPTRALIRIRRHVEATLTLRVSN